MNWAAFCGTIRLHACVYLKEFLMTELQFASMNDLRDFVDLNLARRLEMGETLTPLHVKSMRRVVPDATSEGIAGGTAVFGGTAYPANHIVGMGLYGSVTSADVDQVEEF